MPEADAAALWRREETAYAERPMVVKLPETTEQIV